MIEILHAIDLFLRFLFIYALHWFAVNKLYTGSDPFVQHYRRSDVTLAKPLVAQTFSISDCYKYTLWSPLVICAAVHFYITGTIPCYHMLY